MMYVPVEQNVQEKKEFESHLDEVLFAYRKIIVKICVSEAVLSTLCYLGVMIIPCMIWRSECSSHNYLMLFWIPGLLTQLLTCFFVAYCIYRTQYMSHQKKGPLTSIAIAASLNMIYQVMWWSGWTSENEHYNNERLAISFFLFAFHGATALSLAMFRSPLNMETFEEMSHQEKKKLNIFLAIGIFVWLISAIIFIFQRSTVLFWIAVLAMTISSPFLFMSFTRLVQIPSFLWRSFASVCVFCLWIFVNVVLYSMGDLTLILFKKVFKA